MSVPQYRILTYPNPLLAVPTARVTTFGPTLERIVKRMVPTMRAVDGVGLAGNQVELSLSLATVECRPRRVRDEVERIPLHTLVNPVIVAASDDLDELKEGCLSCPGIEVLVLRSTQVTVRFQTPTGQLVTETVTGFKARIYQHEIDHLNGRTILDRASGQRALIAAYRANPTRFRPERDHS
jgi:peptide deformylase